jgi:hypothetical protein
MHMPSSTSPSSTPHTLHSKPGVREANAKNAPHDDSENVQRFRSLMNGKPQQSMDSAGDNHPAEESSVDIDTDASDDAGQSASADANELSQNQQKALRDLLQRQLGEATGSSPNVAGRDDDDDGSGSDQQGDHRGDDQAGATIGMQALHLAQQAIVQSAEQPVPAQAAMAPALAELIERHVKQLLVPDATSRSSAQAREIMITLKDGLLPGTELWLSRTSDGWKLRADTRSNEAYRSLIEGVPQLIERFAQSRLGSLEVSSNLIA